MRRFLDGLSKLTNVQKMIDEFSGRFRGLGDERARRALRFDSLAGGGHRDAAAAAATVATTASSPARRIPPTAATRAATRTPGAPGSPSAASSPGSASAASAAAAASSTTTPTTCGRRRAAAAASSSSTTAAASLLGLFSLLGGPLRFLLRPSFGFGQLGLPLGEILGTEPLSSHTHTRAHPHST